MSSRRSPCLALPAAILLAAGCAPRIDFGSEILWSARHEIGKLDEWSGAVDDPPTTTAAVTTDVAHTGQYAVKLANAATGAFDTAAIWSEQDFPEAAYYSAWFYLPQANQTTADWTVMQFRAPTVQDPSVFAQGLDIDLRSLPGGDIILSVFDHRPSYLRTPTPDVAMPVPIGRWFQIEVFFRNAADDSGRFTVWLDGQVYYDLQRPMRTPQTSTLVYFSPCSITEDLVPVQSVVYVDDAAVSLIRLTPAGILGN